MTSLKLIGAAMIAASALASPALGQTSITNPAACESMFPNANCDNAGRNSPYASSRQERQYRRTANRNNSGFWPADTAGAVVGAAAGTAAAVATSPFRAWDNSYAYDNRGWDTRTYGQRNGWVCEPGSYFKGEDGRRHLCQ